jgi:hypothetical protein
MFWSAPSERVAIAVRDARSGEAFEFEVDGSAALDAFHHPYAYAAGCHVSLRTTRFSTDGLAVGNGR